MSRKLYQYPPPFLEVSHREALPVDEVRPVRPVVELSEDQHVAAGRILSWFDSGPTEPFFLGGYAGSGKTLVATVVASQLPRPAFGAFTGKACEVLHRRLANLGGGMVQTLHKYMYQPIEDPKSGKLIGFSPRPSPEFDAAGIVVVDEASMLPQSILDDLLAYDVPVLLVGDPAQLPPVNTAGIEFDKFDCSALLEKIHRQEEGSAILDYASHVRQGGAWRQIPRSPEVRMISERQLKGELSRAYADYGAMDTVILCNRNDTRVALNQIALELHRDQVGGQGDFFPGVPVVCLENYTTALLNGSRGWLVAPEVDRYWVKACVRGIHAGAVGYEVHGHLFGPQFDRPRTISEFSEAHALFPELVQEDWSDKLGLLFDFAYAMTVHKFQGSSASCVFLKMERTAYMSDEEFRRWLYTAVTRAEKELVIIA